MFGGDSEQLWACHGTFASGWTRSRSELVEFWKIEAACAVLKCDDCGVRTSGRRASLLKVLTMTTFRVDRQELCSALLLRSLTPVTLCRHEQANAMHRCLLIPELSSQISEYCTQLQDVSSAIDRDDLRTLFALARTCRALLTPALDVMWYRQHTLVHLFKCLPGDLWELTTSASLPQRKELVSCHLSLSRSVHLPIRSCG